MQAESEHHVDARGSLSEASAVVEPNIALSDGATAATLTALPCSAGAESTSDWDKHTSVRTVVEEGEDRTEEPTPALEDDLGVDAVGDTVTVPDGSNEHNGLSAGTHGEAELSAPRCASNTPRSCCLATWTDMLVDNVETVADGVVDEVDQLPFIKGILKNGLEATTLAGTTLVDPPSTGGPRQRNTNAVRFVLPDGHSTKSKTKAKGPKSIGMPKGMTLPELTSRYHAVCKHLEITPLPQIAQPLHEASMRGATDPPSILDLRGAPALDHAHVLAICEYIVQNTMLNEVNFAGIGLRDIHLEKLYQAIKYRRKVYRINLAQNPKISRAGLGYISEVMKQPFLQYINFSGIKLKVKSAEQLKVAIEGSKLRTLIMHNCGLNAIKTLQLIVDGIHSCSSLCSVSFKSNGLTSDSASVIRTLFDNECLLETLDLRSNRLGDAGMVTLAPAIEENRRIRKLVLYDNGISTGGASVLFNALRKNSSLTSLDLSQNPLGDAESMEFLKRLIVVNRSIESLFLWNVGMMNHGLIVLSEGLAENEALKRLEIRNNSMSAIGLMALEHALKLNNTLYKVLLNVPEDRDKTKEALALKAYQQIQHLSGENLLKSKPVEDDEY